MLHQAPDDSGHVAVSSFLGDLWKISVPVGVDLEERQLGVVRRNELARTPAQADALQIPCGSIGRNICNLTATLMPQSMLQAADGGHITPRAYAATAVLRAVPCTVVSAPGEPLGHVQSYCSQHQPVKMVTFGGASNAGLLVKIPQSPVCGAFS